MRIWSIHPKYLDTKGLLALWREALLAKTVLSGKSIGYRNHSQLSRFKASDNPVNALNAYLAEVWHESKTRNFAFDKTKIDWNFYVELIQVHEGQIVYEVKHLLLKLKIRDRLKFEQLNNIQNPEVHPLFKIVPGGIETWEKVPK